MLAAPKAASASLRNTRTTIKKRSDFLAAAGSGRKFITNSFIVQINCRQPAHPAGNGPRVGYTVTKKLGNAVIRNRVRRRLRAAFTTLPEGALHEGYDYIIIARQKAQECSFSDLVRDMGFAFSRIHANKGAPNKE
ncbi:MAG: ribonuclease P protein component [Rickettsiales bacterium]|nr:ribonuclease P protein component [Rickettsiales bacterium]